jgi:acyl-CoA thioesterase-1
MKVDAAAFEDPNAIPSLPNVLLVGDSISIGYTLPVRELLEGKASIFSPPINCQSTIQGLRLLDEWLGNGE